MSNQSYANQLGWAITTKDNLNELSATMRTFSNHYIEQINMLEERDYMAESLNEVRQMSNEFEDATVDIINHIEQSHINYINNQTKAIMEVINNHQ